MYSVILTLFIICVIIIQGIYPSCPIKLYKANLVHLMTFLHMWDTCTFVPVNKNGKTPNYQSYWINPDFIKYADNPGNCNTYKMYNKVHVINRYHLYMNFIFTQVFFLFTSCSRKKSFDFRNNLTLTLSKQNFYIKEIMCH